MQRLNITYPPSALICVQPSEWRLAGNVRVTFSNLSLGNDSQRVVERLGPNSSIYSLPGTTRTAILVGDYLWQEKGNGSYFCSTDSYWVLARASCTVLEFLFGFLMAKKRGLLEEEISKVRASIRIPRLPLRIKERICMRYTYLKCKEC